MIQYRPTEKHSSRSAFCPDTTTVAAVVAGLEVSDASLGSATLPAVRVSCAVTTGGPLSPASLAAVIVFLCTPIRGGHNDGQNRHPQGADTHPDGWGWRGWLSGKALQAAAFVEPQPRTTCCRERRGRQECSPRRAARRPSRRAARRPSPEGRWASRRHIPAMRSGSRSYSCRSSRSGGSVPRSARLAAGPNRPCQHTLPSLHGPGAAARFRGGLYRRPKAAGFSRSC